MSSWAGDIHQMRPALCVCVFACVSPLKCVRDMRACVRTRVQICMYVQECVCVCVSSAWLMQLYLLQESETFKVNSDNKLCINDKSPLKQTGPLAAQYLTDVGNWLKEQL